MDLEDDYFCRKSIEKRKQKHFSYLQARQSSSFLCLLLNVNFLFIFLFSPHNSGVTAYRVNHPKGNSVLYSSSGNDSWGARISPSSGSTLSSATVEESTAASRRIESASPSSAFTSHFPRLLNDEEEGETESDPSADGPDDSGDSGVGFIPTPPPYRPPIYTESMTTTRYRGPKRSHSKSSSFLGDSKYPSMMPQIAKVLLQSQSSQGATPRPGNSRHPKQPGSKQPKTAAQSQAYFEQYINFDTPADSGVGATTPETGAYGRTESPAGEVSKSEDGGFFDSRPYYESSSKPKPKPRPRSGRRPPASKNHHQYTHKFETTLESPPAGGGSAGGGATYGKVVMYSTRMHPSPKPDNDEPTDSWQNGERGGQRDQPATTSSSSSDDSSDDSFVPDDFDGFNFEKVPEGTSPLDDQPSRPYSKPKGGGSGSSFGNKFNPANSVVSGPNSYMTLSYEPLSDEQKASLAGKRRSSGSPSSSVKPMTTFHYHQQQPKKSAVHKQRRLQQNEPEYVPNQHRAPALVYRTQTEHSALSMKENTEDQQESPDADADSEGNDEPDASADPILQFNYADTYARRGLHDAPEVPAHFNRQSKGHRRNNNQQRRSRTPLKAADTYSFEGSHQHLTAARQPEVAGSGGDDNGLQQQQPVKLTYYRSYRRRDLPLSADSHLNGESTTNRYLFTPEGESSTNYPSYPSSENPQTAASSPSQLQAEKYDFSESVKKYAKEFGFEVPSKEKAEVGSVVQKKEEKEVSTGSAAANSNSRATLLLSDQPQSKSSSASNGSSKNDSHYYFNMLFPEFSSEFKEKYQNPSKAEGLGDLLSSSLEQQPSSKDQTPQNGQQPKEGENKEPDDFRSVMSTFVALVGDETVTSELAKPSAKTVAAPTEVEKSSSTSGGVAKENELSKEDIDAILLKFNEVISSKEKAAAVEASKVDADDADFH